MIERTVSAAQSGCGRDCAMDKVQSVLHRTLQRMAELNGGQRPPEFASTHPDPANRMQRLQALMPKAQQIRAKFGKEKTVSGTLLPGQKCP